MIKNVFIGILILGVNLMAENLENELQVFTAQKYRVDYTKQSNEAQEDIKKEYENTKKLSSKIYSEIKNNLTYKIALDNLNITVWSQKFMATLKITEDDLKHTYEKEAPKALARYSLRNILVKNEKKANDILSRLQKAEEADLVVIFTKVVQEDSEDITTRLKEGKLGWLDINKLEKPLQDALKDKKKNDLVKIKLNNLGWQIILVEDYQASRKATYEESKQYLNNIIRQQKLNEEIQKLLK